MGLEGPSYQRENSPIWCQTGISSDGRIFFGQGATALQAQHECLKQIQEREEFLKLSPYERLRILVNLPDIHQNELIEAVRMIGKLLVLKYDQDRTGCVIKGVKI